MDWEPRVCWLPVPGVGGAVRFDVLPKGERLVFGGCPELVGARCPQGRQSRRLQRMPVTAPSPCAAP